MSDVLMADVLWDAANVQLDAVGGVGVVRRSLYSCCAAEDAAWVVDASWQHVIALLASLGCDLDSSTAFQEFPAGPERQGVRYMWLLLAYHYALDEGLTC